jgi:hypothetical protein
MKPNHVVRLLAIVAAAALLLGACGGSGSSSSSQQTSQQDVTPAGDIPDTQHYVVYSSPSGFTMKVPEGWAQTSTPAGVTFADNLNSLRIEATPTPSAPDVASAPATELPGLRSSVAGFQLEGTEAVVRSAGTAVLVRYRADGPPNPVTTKRTRLEVQRYEFWRNGLRVTLTLASPATADNTDPWRIMTNSFAWQ